MGTPAQKGSSQLGGYLGPGHCIHSAIWAAEGTEHLSVSGTGVTAGTRQRALPRGWQPLRRKPEGKALTDWWCFEGNNINWRTVGELLQRGRQGWPAQGGDVEQG